MAFIRKQSAQLASKLRYLSCQFIPYLNNDLWLTNARRANAQAEKLEKILKQYPEIHFTQKMESNQLFFTLPTEALRRLQAEYFFYMWDESKNEARLVASWDTTDADIEQLAKSLEQCFASSKGL